MKCPKTQKECSSPVPVKGPWAEPYVLQVCPDCKMIVPKVKKGEKEGGDA